MKRGMSNVVSTVLLISLIVILATGVIIWINTSLFKTQKATAVSQYCSATNILVGDFCYEMVPVTNSKTNTVTTQENLKFSVANNLNIPLEGIQLLVQYQNGNSVPLGVVGGGKVNASGVVKETTDFLVGSDSGIVELKVMPEVKVNNETITCKDNAQIFKWSDIKQC